MAVKLRLTPSLPSTPSISLTLTLVRPRPTPTFPARPLERRYRSTLASPSTINFRRLRLMMEAQERYEGWSKESLIQRVAELEVQASQQRARESGFVPSPSPYPNIVTTATDASTSEPASSRSKKKRIRPGKTEKVPRAFDISTHPCRKIALRFSYEGSGYSGLAAQNGPQGVASSLPTVEAVLWEALVTARLVDPITGMEGTGWTRCGRTDRGVSAAGQVVAFWIRSKKVDQWQQRREQEGLKEEAVARRAAAAVGEAQGEAEATTASPLVGVEADAEVEVEVEVEVEARGIASPADEDGNDTPSPRPPVKLEDEELPYVATLNRILPTSIRVQAWAPVRPDFSARLDCTYRHYKYFFTAGPSPHLLPATKDGREAARAKRLDIAAMRDAATRLLGEHDFRNLCKIDATKQITNYRRRIDGIGIDRVSRGWPLSSSSSKRPNDGEADEYEHDDDDDDDEPMYVFNLRGTAFLYHQVRNIMAVLFLVGARLEKPQIVDELMNVERGTIARDRIKMKLAALNGTARETKRGDPSTASVANEATGDDQESGRAAADKRAEQQEVRWWRPIRATRPPSPDALKEWGRPQWLSLSLSWADDELEASVAAADQGSDGLAIYGTKPNFEMASDRPLMLWECGFLPGDVSWRAGPCDGPLAVEGADGKPDDKDAARRRRGREESARVASSSALDLHTLWTQMSIKTELQRHFILASASPRSGTLACRNEFETGRHSALEHGPLELEEDEGEGEGEVGEKKTKGGTWNKGTVPLGYGAERGAMRYIPLVRRTREDSFADKNRRWMETAGRRRAERGQTVPVLGSGEGETDDE